MVSLRWHTSNWWAGLGSPKDLELGRAPTEGCKLKQAFPLFVNGVKFLKISLGKHVTTGVRVNSTDFIFYQHKIKEVEETLSTPAPLLKIWEDWGQVAARRVRAGITLNHAPPPVCDLLSHNFATVDSAIKVTTLKDYLCWAWVMLSLPECQSVRQDGLFEVVSRLPPLLFLFLHSQ